MTKFIFASILVMSCSGINLQNIEKGCGKPSPIDLIKNNQIEELRVLLHKNKNLINKMTKEGAPIHVAVDLENIEAIDCLLDMEADLSVKDKKHKNKKLGTPLLEAAIKGNKTIAQKLIARGANINDGHADNTTPLIAALRAQQKEMAEFLLKQTNIENGINVQGKNQSTALMVASTYGYQEIVKDLLSKNAKTDLVHFEGATALYLAVQSRQEEIVDILLQHGTNEINNSRPRSTMLMLACSKGDLGIAKLLLQHGVSSLHTRGTYIDVYSTPLYLATNSGNYELVKTLLEYSTEEIEVGKPEHQRDIPNFCWNPFNLAIWNKSKELAELFISKKEEMSETTFQNAFYLAAQTGFVDAVRLFIDQGIENKPNDGGLMAIHYAAMGSHVEIGQILIKWDHNNLNAPIKTDFANTKYLWKKGNEYHCGITPAHIVIMYNCIPFLKMLIDNEAKTDEVDMYNWTPLKFILAQEDVNPMKLEIEQILLSNGADREKLKLAKGRYAPASTNTKTYINTNYAFYGGGGRW